MALYWVDVAPRLLTKRRLRARSLAEWLHVCVPGATVGAVRKRVALDRLGRRRTRNSNLHAVTICAGIVDRAAARARGVSLPGGKRGCGKKDESERHWWHRVRLSASVDSRGNSARGRQESASVTQCKAGQESSGAEGKQIRGGHSSNAAHSVLLNTPSSARRLLPAVAFACTASSYKYAFSWISTLSHSERPSAFHVHPGAQEMGIREECPVPVDERVPGWCKLASG